LKILLISAKKNEPAFMLEWRLRAYQRWAKPIVYYSAPKRGRSALSRA
jgi:Fe-S cluster assembly scaffold protein SufB